MALMKMPCAVGTGGGKFFYHEIPPATGTISPYSPEWADNIGFTPTNIVFVSSHGNTSIRVIVCVYRNGHQYITVPSQTSYEYANEGTGGSYAHVTPKTNGIQFDNLGISPSGWCASGGYVIAWIE